MTTKSKSILDEAYDEARALEAALKANAKDLLSATMKTDLESLVKESLEDDDKEDADDVDIDIDDDVDSYDTVDDTDMDDSDVEDSDDDDSDFEDSDDDDSDDTDELAGLGDDTDFGDDMDDETTDIEPMDSGVDVVDMTAASDGEVLKVFKQMGPEDGIVVTRDPQGNIDVNTGTEEFKIMTSEPSVEEDETFMDLGTDEDSVEGDEVMYELDLSGLDEDMFEGENSPFDSKISVSRTNPMNGGTGRGQNKNAPYTGKNSVDTDAPFTTRNRVQAVSEGGDIEADMYENKPRVMANRFRTTSNNQNAGPYTDGQRQTRGALQQNEEIVRYQKLVENLKAENKNFKKAVEDFRKKLHEVAVFNSNLAYAVRLFTEQTTTKKEKINILRRFDNVKTLEESKRLFESVQKELNSTLIKESKTVDEKITKTPRTGSGMSESNTKTQIFESKIYEDPKFKRSLDIMKKINK